MTLVEISMLPWTALEYGQMPCAASASSSATSRSTPGRLTLRRARRKNALPSRFRSISVSTAGCCRQLDLLLGGGELDRAEVAGRPGAGEQVLGGRVRLRQLDVDEAVAAAGGAVGAAGGVGAAGEEDFCGGGHGRFPFCGWLFWRLSIKSYAIYMASRTPIVKLAI